MPHPNQIIRKALPLLQVFLEDGRKFEVSGDQDSVEISWSPWGDEERAGFCGKPDCRCDGSW